MAADYMVFNVTKDDIKVRMSAIDEEIWPLSRTRPKSRDPKAGDTFSDYIKNGRELMPELIKQIYSDFNKQNGTDVPVPTKNHLMTCPKNR